MFFDDVLMSWLSKNSLVKLENDRLVLNYGLIEERRTGSHPDRGPESDQDDSATTATSVTDEDVIEEAIRARDNRVLEDDYDDDEEEIVYLQWASVHICFDMWLWQ